MDQLVPIARALDTTVDHLVEACDDDDVVIRPEPQHMPGITTWLMSRESTVRGVTVAKMRISPEHPPGPRSQGVHPAREWFTVLYGTVRLQLGERVMLVEAGDAAEFSTMVPHSLTALDGPVEILAILDHDGARAHMPPPGGVGTSARTQDVETSAGRAEAP